MSDRVSRIHTHPPSGSDRRRRNSPVRRLSGVFAGACAALLMVIALTSLATVAVANPAWPPIRLIRPVPGEVTTPFDPPTHIGDSAHRGVDLAADVGTSVVAAAGGRVSHVGVINGVPTVSITHDEVSRLRTTYQPVVASVRVGDLVEAGQPIGTVGKQAMNATHRGLHWGLIRGDHYLNPLDGVAPSEPGGSSTQVRLLPVDAVPRPRAAPGPGLPELSPGSTRPADGPITSPFGMRLHPVLKVWRLHDGVDLGAGCGAPVRSVQPGRVIVVERHTAYGIRVIVEHDGGLRTGYAHLGASRVGIGDQVSAGQRLGDVGSTGWSTGCHLHFMAWRDGQVINPTGFVS